MLKSKGPKVNQSLSRSCLSLLSFRFWLPCGDLTRRCMVVLVLVVEWGSYQTLYGRSGSGGGVGILPDVVW